MLLPFLQGYADVGQMTKVALEKVGLRVSPQVQKDSMWQAKPILGTPLSSGRGWKKVVGIYVEREATIAKPKSKSTKMQNKRRNTAAAKKAKNAKRKKVKG
ncbi:hypothetical protein PF008_g5068 [Phytophthora fragariae]|uniref:Uncharacterized protein n=1 Tax=Phytophthora fragariae TaxID=53985 RepID=A0A6G0S9F2_9STRA|nr:hypothetical protein PF008_g5068 [Phytophthora fragariae]